MLDITFLSLAKNCEKTIPAYLQLLNELRADGLHCSAFVGENGSRDETGALLNEAHKRGDITLVSTSFMSDIQGRMHRMATGRQYLKDVYEGSQAARCVCVADVDNVIDKPPSIDAIHSAIRKLYARNDIFAVAATSRPRYYDLSAYEDDSLSFEFLFEQIQQQKSNLLFYHQFFKRNVYPYQRILTTDHEVLCNSAFNGMTFYQAEAYRLGSYKDADYRRCEHVTLNRQIAKATGKRVLIDPCLMLNSPIDHMETTFARFAWYRLQKICGFGSVA